MKRIVLALLFVAALLLPVACAGNAHANPVGVTISQSAATVRVGEPVTYSGTGTCDTVVCRTQIVGFGPGFSRLGSVLCECSTFTTSWATPGYKQIQYRMTNSRGTNGRTQADIVTTVTP
jgi:hypothetical protein